MRLRTFLTALTTFFAGGAAFAQGLPILGQPEQGKMGFQPAATELMRDIQWLDGMVLIIITAITLFVMALLLICIVRFNQKANPEPASFTHNTPIEVAWKYRKRFARNSREDMERWFVENALPRRVPQPVAPAAPPASPHGPLVCLSAIQATRAGSRNRSRFSMPSPPGCAPRPPDPFREVSSRA